MKTKIILLSLTLFIFDLGYSQINIQKITTRGDSILHQIKYGNTILAKLIIQTYPKDTVYKITFQNAGYYHDLNSGTLTDSRKQPECHLIFDGTKKTLDTLYNVLISVFDRKNRNNPNYKIDLLLGETEISILPIQDNGLKAQINIPHGYINLTRREIKKLLGKTDSDED